MRRCDECRREPVGRELFIAAPRDGRAVAPVVCHDCYHDLMDARRAARDEQYWAEEDMG